MNLCVRMGSVDMSTINELEERLIEIKLKKRNLILANKNTEDIDKEIKELENVIKNKKFN